MSDNAPRAGEVLLAYLAGRVEVVRSVEKDVGLVDPDAVEQTRTAMRAMSSVLSTHRRLVHRDRTDPLRDELKWFVAVLGRAERAADARALHAALDSVRYVHLRRAMERLLSSPPLRRKARRPAARVLPPLAGEAAAAVDQAARRAAEAGLSLHEREDRLDEVRKKARRARYAAEVALPVGGKGARLMVERMTQLQQSLEARTSAGDGDTAYVDALRAVSRDKVRSWAKGSST